MMTQPIRTFEDLTSETAPAGGNGIAKIGFTFDDRRLIELRARYARAELMANALGDGLLWLGRQYRRLVAGIKADMRVRAAEAQLHRMTEREPRSILCPSSGFFGEVCHSQRIYFTFINPSCVL